MLAANFVFVLGIPVALVQLFRSYGGTDLSGPFRGLDTGNIKARKGDVGGALQQYRTILERVPHCAGLKYNLGLALLQQGDRSRAADSFAAALEDCVNYVPAYAVVSPLYEELGETDRLAELPAEVEHGDEKPAEDLINFAFLGTREQVEEAFLSAGWSSADALTPKTFARMYAAFACSNGEAATKGASVPDGSPYG